jgi:hypothetical protein
MSAKEVEADLLTRCAAVARDAMLFPYDQREANVFRLAAMAGLLACLACGTC